MSLYCLHSFYEADLHRNVLSTDYCEHCAAVPMSASASARFAETLQRGLQMPMESAGVLRGFAPEYLFVSRARLPVTQHDGWARRHAECGGVVVRTRGFWMCDCGHLLRSQGTYEGLPLPPRLPVARTVYELKAQDWWHRSQLAVTQKILARCDRVTPDGRVYFDEVHWPLVLTWGLFVICALREGIEQKMGPYWEYMQMYLDAWSSCHE